MTEVARNTLHTPERQKTPELWDVRLVLEYDPNDGQSIYKQDTSNDNSDPEKWTVNSAVIDKLMRYARQDAKFSLANPSEGGDEIKLCFQPDTDRSVGDKTPKSLFIAGSDSTLISFGFDELLKVTDEYVDVLRDDIRYRFTVGIHDYSYETAKRKSLLDIPECLYPDKSIRVFKLSPDRRLMANGYPAVSTSDESLVSVNEAPEINRWKVLETPLPEEASLQQIERLATTYFEASVEAIFSHVASHSENYPTITEVEENGNPAPIHLPAIRYNDRYYQISTSSSNSGTIVEVKNVQPGTKQDTIGDALGRLSVDEFKVLLGEPEKLEDMFINALAESQLIIMQSPAGEVIIIGGDNFEKRLEAKDAPYLPIVRKTTELIKTYIDEVERLPDNVETLLDKRRALTMQILAQQSMRALDIEIPKERSVFKLLWQTLSGKR